MIKCKNDSLISDAPFELNYYVVFVVVNNQDHTLIFLLVFISFTISLI
jgi:hypothetical protein